MTQVTRLLQIIGFGFLLILLVFPGGEGRSSSSVEITSVQTLFYRTTLSYW